MGCPVCRKEYSLFNQASDVYWEIQGGGRAVCKKCAKTKRKEIDEHNIPYVSNGGMKDIDCKHEWMHPNPNIWFCSKCKAIYRWMCGCGGSEYVCEKHHLPHQEIMKKEEGSVESYLAKHSN